ncbi:hypothetical protein Hanom_Chr01g00040321 [Helianthus anomalus]
MTSIAKSRPVAIIFRTLDNCRGVNEPGKARLGSSCFYELELEFGSVRAYLFELELGSRVKSKAQARIGLARAILRTTSNNLKARLKLSSISLKRAKARLANFIIIIIILYIKINLFGLV